MKRVAMILAFALAATAGACSSERDVTCELTWSAEDTELGSTTLVYEALDDLDAGLEMCSADEADHPDRPDGAASHFCDCST